MRALREKELHALFVIVGLLFIVFLALPLVLVLGRSVMDASGAFTLANYAAVFSDPEFVGSIINSLKVSAAAALISVAFAFLLSYSVNYTNLPTPAKSLPGCHEASRASFEGMGAQNGIAVRQTAR